MTSQLYPSAREKFLTAQLSWLTGAYRAIALPESYIPDFDDTVVADVLAGVRIATSDEIENRTATKGFAMCDPVHFGLLVDTRKVNSLVFFKDTGDEGTSDLIAFIDSADIIGAPVALVGFDYFFVPSSLNGSVFRL